MSEHRDFLQDLLTSAPSGADLPIPGDLGAFVGRTDELAWLAALPDEVRTVTLVGPAGVGKTRVAREYATRSAADHPGGVRFLDLSGVADVESLHGLLSDALSPWISASLEASGDPARRYLLVLDSCDRLASACTRAVLALTKACPGIRVLMTSREDAGLAPAGVLPVRPLPFVATVRLFAARAGETRRPPTPAQLPEVTAICRLLDGNPLAVELAAARTNVLSLRQVLDRLGRDPLGLLTAPPAGARPGRSLTAALDAGDELLDEAQRVLLRRLSVFAQPCGLDAVEEVCADDRFPRGGICDLLAALSAKSLINCDTSGDEATYAMGPLIRAYAARRLAEADETQAIERRHARAHAALAGERALPGSRFAELSAVLDRATRAETADPEFTDHALRIAVAVSGHWWRSGRFAEARDRLSALLADDRDGTEQRGARAALGFFAALLGDLATPERVLPLGLIALPDPHLLAGEDADGLASGLALLARSDAALRQGRLYEAEKAAAEVLDLAADTSDAPLGILARRALAEAALALGRRDEARRLIPRALVDARATGSDLLLGLCLEAQGRVAEACADEERAVAAYESVLALETPGTERLRAAARLGLCRAAPSATDPYASRRLADAAAHVARVTGDDHLLADALRVLARQAADGGDREHARTLQHKALDILGRLGAEHAAAECLGDLAVDAAARGAMDLAARLLAAIEAFDTSSGRVPPPADTAARTELLARVRANLSAERFAAARALGAAAPLTLTIAHVRSDRGLRHRANGWSGLTAAELEVVRLVAEGLTNRETAERLCLSPRTIQAHLAHVYDKLGVRSRRDLARESTRRAGHADLSGTAFDGSALGSAV